MIAPQDDPRARRAWLREVVGWWKHLNWNYLGESLRPPSFQLSDSSTELGRWWRERRLLEISAPHIWEGPWSEVLHTLRHEMAHQFADEVLKQSGEPPHGEAFREGCRRLRIEARACAREPGAKRPRAEPTAAVRGDSPLHAKIAKLLSLADSPNEHEAQAAMKKARQLMLRHNLDPADLEAPGRRYSTRRLGELKGRRSSWEYLLGAILSDFFFVHVLWTDDYDPRRDLSGRVLEAYGTDFNLDMAEYVHGYLTQLLPRLWDEYRQRRKIRGHRERRTFYAGVLGGFSEQLEKQEASLREEKALVWTGDPGLDSFFTHLHPRTTTRRAGGIDPSTTYWDGVSEGRSVRLRKPLRSGGDDRRRRLSD